MCDLFFEVGGYLAFNVIPVGDGGSETDIVGEELGNLDKIGIEVAWAPCVEVGLGAVSLADF